MFRFFDSGFDVVAGFISWFKKNIEEQGSYVLRSQFILFLIFLFN